MIIYLIRRSGGWKGEDKKEEQEEEKVKGGNEGNGSE